MNIEFLDVFIHCGLDTVQKSGKYLCPFCGKYAFVAYQDANCYCHNCKFSGNTFKFYANVKNISYDDAIAELKEARNNNKINLRKLSFEEELKKLREDLHYLAMVRMYFDFYKGGRAKRSDYRKLLGFSDSVFSRIINGDKAHVSDEEWNKAIVFFQSKLNVKQFKTDLAKGDMYFHDEAYELLK